MQVLAGIGENVVKARGLQQDLVQMKASLSQESAEVQALPGERGTAG